MKKYPSYTTINNFYNEKKGLYAAKYEKPTTPSSSSSRLTPVRNTINNGISKFQFLYRKVKPTQT